uniref:Ribosomal protein S20 n=1 Tax=Bangiopsis subsimplex TaxID=139980 RepID=A0A1C9CCS1_9RHOD|nr:ribosomal protein S20 [Bangiopsis subsimplex]AOM66193.1 ribosomal protein S20 [Bangiopsis subsimplex]ARO90446.1 30S ribosomal protein S20 [Bangiopsis subsimplex]
MTQKKSIAKRIRVAKRNQIQNKKYKTGVKNIIKKCLTIIDSSSGNISTEVSDSVSLAYSKIDKAVQKKVFHINTGARKKSRIAKALHKLK